MRTIRRHLTYTRVAATLALSLAAGGVAFAASGNGKTIHACYKTHGGALRIAGRCKHAERPLSWGQIGPAGARGATGSRGKTGTQGTTGVQGQAGPAGPSDVYLAGASTGTLASGFASYGALSLPAGSYLLEAKVAVEGKTPSASCALASNTSLTTVWDRASASGESVLALIGAATFGSAQTVELVCKGSGEVKDAHLVALKTAALHGAFPAA